MSGWRPRLSVALLALATIGAVGGTAAASDYPPDDPAETTVPPELGVLPLGQLPATGNDTDAMLGIAAGAVITGLGLLALSRHTRRPADN